MSNQKIVVEGKFKSKECEYERKKKKDSNNNMNDDERKKEGDVVDNFLKTDFNFIDGFEA